MPAWAAFDRRHHACMHSIRGACCAQKQLGAVGDVGFKQAMQQKWLAMDKSSGSPMIVRKVIVRCARI